MYWLFQGPMRSRALGTGPACPYGKDGIATQYTPEKVSLIKTNIA